MIGESFTGPGRNPTQPQFALGKLRESLQNKAEHWAFYLGYREVNLTGALC